MTSSNKRRFSFTDAERRLLLDALEHYLQEVNNRITPEHASQGLEDFMQDVTDFRDLQILRKRLS